MDEEMETATDIRFVLQSFKGEAHICWKTILNMRGREKALNMGRRKFRKVFLKKYVPGHEVELLKDETST
jgi:hypothetical protein